jgi:hypothetical protein
MTKLDPTQITRFMEEERELRSKAIDRLADALGLVLVPVGGQP